MILLQKNTKLQNQGTRVVTGNPNDQSSLPLLLQLERLTIKEMIDFETARTVYKVLKGLVPPYKQSMFRSRSETCNINLSNTGTDFKIPL